MLFFRKQIIIITNGCEKVRENLFMKRCPQCNTVFGDEVVYCSNDGAALLKESFSLPSQSDFEDETIIRREPIYVDLSNKNTVRNEVPNRQTAPPVEDVIVRVAPKNNSAKYALFLLVGLLLGGGLVLATLLLTRNPASNETNNNPKTNSTIISETTATPKKTESPTTTNINANIVDLSETASDIHSGHTADDDEEFNGRVISLNAYVRASPNRNAAQLDILPVDDRLTITARNDPNGLWFHVVCEHGASGWMHGNTIEYTR